MSAPFFLQKVLKCLNVLSLSCTESRCCPIFTHRFLHQACPGKMSVMKDRPIRKLAAVVAMDVVGFSHLIEEDEDATINALRLTRYDILDPLIENYHGRIANTAGDSVLIEFSSIVEAVRCSIAFQESVDVRVGETALTFRVGINLGDVVENGTDLLGDGVNVAARIEALCAPGGISLSDSAYRQVEKHRDWNWIDGGLQNVKNLA